MTNQKIIKIYFESYNFTRNYAIIFTITEGLTKIKKTNKIDVL